MKVRAKITDENVYIIALYLVLVAEDRVKAQPMLSELRDRAADEMGVRPWYAQERCEEVAMFVDEVRVVPSDKATADKVEEIRRLLF